MLLIFNPKRELIRAYNMHNSLRKVCLFCEVVSNIPHYQGNKMLNDAENEIGYWEVIYIRLCMMKSNNEYDYYSD